MNSNWLHWLTTHALFRALAAAICAGFSACATSGLDETVGDYPHEIASLNRQLLLKQNDPALQRDLGILYFKTKRYDAAKLYLFRSCLQVPEDARTVFYYGMTLEYLGDQEGALRLYSAYPGMSSPYRKLIEGRYMTLTKEVLSRRFQSLMEDEKKLGAVTPAPNAVAVFPLHYQDADPAYESLGKGISEMILVDLGQVKRIQVLERIRIETLLDELKFGQSKNVDQATAPRLGRLLSAGRIIGGSYNLSRDKSLTVNVASLNAMKNEPPNIITASDDLDGLFRLEKQLVFSILDKLGIPITPAERDVIQRVPTRNLRAFMLYCSGLERQDAGDFKGAGDFFHQALALDPAFAPASSAAAASEAFTIAGGPKEKALDAAKAFDPSARQAEAASRPNNLINSRLQNLGSNVGSNFYPGANDRKGAADASRFGIIGGIIGVPPPPPSR